MTFVQWREAVEEVLQHPPYHRGMRMLSDRHRLKRGYSFTFMEEIADFFRSHAGELGPTRWAVVTAPENLAASLLQFGAELAQNSLVHVQGSPT